MGKGQTEKYVRCMKVSTLLFSRSGYLKINQNRMNTFAIRRRSTFQLSALFFVPHFVAHLKSDQGILYIGYKSIRYWIPDILWLTAAITIELFDH